MHSFRSELNQVFFEHWRSLRKGNGLPLLKDFLAHPHPQLQPQIVIKDILPTKSIRVRLHGTRLVDLAGEDLTGRDLLEYADTPKMADELWGFQKTVADHPVGLSVLKNTVTSSDRRVTFEEVSLPAEPFPGGPPCVIGSVVLMEDIKETDVVSHLLAYSAPLWIDLGWGTPDQAG